MEGLRSKDQSSSLSSSKEVDTQSTSTSSRLLDACRHFNAGIITEDELVTTTALLGFDNVIDAFHAVGTAQANRRDKTR